MQSAANTPYGPWLDVTQGWPDSAHAAIVPSCRAHCEQHKLGRVCGAEAARR